MHTADDPAAGRSNVVSLNDRVFVRALIRDLDTLLVDDVEKSGVNIVSFCGYRKRTVPPVHEVDLSRYTITVLGPRIGHRYALLLHLMGYRLLEDLAAAHPSSITSIPGIGERRLRAITTVLAEQGFASPPSGDPAQCTEEESAQLEFELT